MSKHNRERRAAGVANAKSHRNLVPAPGQSRRELAVASGHHPRGVYYRTHLGTDRPGVVGLKFDPPGRRAGKGLPAFV